MGIRQTGRGVILEAAVKAGAGSFSVSQKDGFLEIRTKSPAEGNKANQEIIKELSKLFGKDVRILRGLKSKRKEILVEGASVQDAERVLK